MYKNANEISFLEKIGILGLLICIGWLVWHHFNAPEVLIEKEFSTLTPASMSKKTFTEIKVLNEKLYQYKTLTNSGFSGEWNDDEASFYQTNLQRVRDAYVDKIATNSIETKELLSFASEKLCDSITDMSCFDRMYWLGLTEPQKKSIVQAFQYHFDHSQDKHDKGILALLLGMANYTGSGLMSKNYASAINYFVTAWKLDADGAAYCLYRSYSSFDRKNNVGNMYLWALRSSKNIIDVSDLEKGLSAEKINVIQALARDPAILIVGDSQ